MASGAYVLARTRKNLGFSDVIHMSRLISQSEATPSAFEARQEDLPRDFDSEGPFRSRRETIFGWAKSPADHMGN